MTQILESSTAGDQGISQMKALLLYPKFPSSFWSFEKTVKLSGAKALMPPLGLITVAALLPQTWQFTLVDRNVREVEEAEWEAADIVLLSGMIAQKADMLEQIREAKRRGKRVAVGGPYATSVSSDVEAAGADYLVLDEGEVTIPQFLDALAENREQGIFRSADKPDVTQTPVPRFDLLEFGNYDSMPVQYSRGCPFLCEFCDIISLYGRRPRTKTPEQILRELSRLYELGWRGAIFLVDDNFIGNKRNVKLMLREMKDWQVAHSYPFSLTTETSIDLASDAELMELMVLSNFKRVFIGFETPDEESLIGIGKKQNVRQPLLESAEIISRAGLQIMAGFIMGFDGERSGAGRRVVDLAEAAALPVAFFNTLQALPNTAMWARLERENRLVDKVSDANGTTLTNFVPTRPIEEIAGEYVEAMQLLYDPDRYLGRVYRQSMKLGTRAQYSAAADLPRPRYMRGKKAWRALLLLCWRQGMVRKTRRRFWRYLLSLMRRNPSHVGVYLRTCAYAEHFIEFQQIVQRDIERQVTQYRRLEHAARQQAPAST